MVELTRWEPALLFGAAFLGGALNALAGGGSFLTFPALLACRVDAIVANATSTVALLPGALASGFGYRATFQQISRKTWAWMGLVSLLGGALGAKLLVRTPPRTFLAVLPVLMAAAAIAFTLGPRWARRWKSAENPTGHSHFGWAVAAQLPIALYGGYFGGGMGLMMLAAYALTLPTFDIHVHNGLKSLLAVALNLTAALTFVASGKVAWTAAVPMMVGAIVGGFVGSRAARRFAPAKVRLAVAALGWSLTAYFFWRAFQQLQSP